MLADIPARAGIGEATIARLVRVLCAKVRMDPWLGPAFEARAGDRKGNTPCVQRYRK